MWVVLGIMFVGVVWAVIKANEKPPRTMTYDEHIDLLEEQFKDSELPDGYWDYMRNRGYTKQNDIDDVDKD